jgi:hypothetical protein
VVGGVRKGGAPPPPPQGDGEQQAVVSVRDGGGECVTYQVKLHVQVGRMVERYAQVKGARGLGPEDFRFLYNDRVLQSDDTLASLGVAAGQRVEFRVVAALQGLRRPEHEHAAAPEAAAEIRELAVKNPIGDVVVFRVKPCTRMGKVMERYATHYKIPVDKLRFSYNNQRLSSDDTPDSLGIVGRAELVASLAHGGGGQLWVHVQAAARETLTLRVVATDGSGMGFTLHHSTRLRHLFAKYAQLNGFVEAAGQLKFYAAGGMLLEGEHTVRDVGLRDGDQIVVRYTVRGS